MCSKSNNEYSSLHAVAEGQVQTHGKPFSADEHTSILRHHVQSRGRLNSLVAGRPLSRP